MLAFGMNNHNQLSWTPKDKYTNLDIKFVLAGEGFFILGNHETQKYYGTGSNDYGQLASVEIGTNVEL